MSGSNLMNDAGVIYDDSRRGVKARLRGKTRAIGRAWSWGDKKKAAQVVGGVALGVVGVAVTAATFGAATPAGVVLAVGGFGLASGGTFASSRYNLKHRPKNSARIEKLVAKLDSVAKETTGRDDYHTTKDDLKYWRNNAHKSARRCIAHWRKAIKAGEKVSGALDLGGGGNKATVASCDEAVLHLSDFMKFVHHLDKTRLYLLPTIIIAEAFNELYGTLYAWTNQVQAARFDEWLKKSKHLKTCGRTCYHGSGRQPFRLYPDRFPEPANPTLLDTAVNINQMKDDRARMLEGEGEDVGGPQLAAYWQQDGYRGDLSSITGGTSDANQLAQRMLNDVAAVFDQPAATVRVKRNIKGWGQRRTKGEIAAFAIQNLIGAAGAAVGASQVASLTQNITTVIELGKQLALDVGLEVGSHVVDHLAGVPADAGDDVENAQQEVQASATKSHHHFAKVGRQQQGRLEKIAIHLAEALKSASAFEETKQINNCDQALELARRYYKVKHHLIKAETYGLDGLTQLAHALAESTNAMMKIQSQAWARYESLAKTTVQKNDDWHKNCSSCCYAPFGSLPTVPRHAVGGIDLTA